GAGGGGEAGRWGPAKPAAVQRAIPGSWSPPSSAPPLPADWNGTAARRDSAAPRLPASVTQGSRSAAIRATAHRSCDARVQQAIQHIGQEIQDQIDQADD